MTILVTGTNGQLGKELQVLAKDFSAIQFLFADRTTLDIADQQSIADFFAQHTIDVCINCAAYTAVDKAETAQEAALLANATGVGWLATTCAQQNALLVHVSTDYVFDGTSSTPYVETDATNPIGVYGATKLAGEVLALQNNSRTVVVRTSWVFSSFGNNFVKTMMRLMKERESIGVVNDQIGSPTYAAHLAKAILQMVVQGKAANLKGIYHFANEGQISWFEFATAIRNAIHSHCVVNPIASSDYPTPAKRPAFSLLNTHKIKTTFDLKIPDWQTALRDCLAILQA
jgi:dTDP-4-dehydrorhamnose reductase